MSFWLAGILWSVELEASVLCSNVLKIFSQQKQAQIDSLDSQRAQLGEIFSAFAQGLDPDLANREQRIAFQTYLKWLFGRSDINISQPDGKDPIELVAEAQKDFQKLKKPHFFSIVLKTKDSTASNESPEKMAFLKSHLSRLKQIQTKFLKIEANRGFWKTMLDAQSLGDEAFMSLLDAVIYPLNREALEHLDEIDQNVVAQLFKSLKAYRNQMMDAGKEIKKISRALADLIHVSSFLGGGLGHALGEANESMVLEALDRSLMKRDRMSQELGYSEGFQQALSRLGVLVPSGLDSNASLENLARQLRLSRDEPSHSRLVGAPRHLRRLSMTESAFRSCVGGDCSTRESLSEAFDPNYVYFTITDERNKSSGLFTVVLGEASFRGKMMPVAFLDKIQNVSSSDLELALDALRESLAMNGVRLISATELGDHNGLSNDESMKFFLNAKNWLGEERIQGFQPHPHKFSFKHVHTRARKNLDWRFVLPFSESREFRVLETSDAKEIFYTDFRFDRLLEPFYELKNSSGLADQMRYLPSMEVLKKAGLKVDPDFQKTLQEWLRSAEADFKLKKQVMIFYLQTQRESFFSELALLDQEQQLDLIQNLMDTPRYNDLLFQKPKDWVNLLYRFKDREPLVEQILKEVDSIAADRYRDWLQRGVSEQEFLSLLRFHREDIHQWQVEDLETVERMWGLEPIFDRLVSVESEEAQIHKIWRLGNNDVFDWISNKFSQDQFFELLKLPRRDGKKTIHILAESPDASLLGHWMNQNTKNLWFDLILEPEENEIGRKTIHWLGQKNQEGVLGILFDRLNRDELMKVLSAFDSKGDRMLHLAAMMGHQSLFHVLRERLAQEDLKDLSQLRNAENKNVVETAKRYMRYHLAQWLQDL